MCDLVPVQEKIMVDNAYGVGVGKSNNGSSDGSGNRSSYSSDSSCNCNNHAGINIISFKLNACSLAVPWQTVSLLVLYSEYERRKIFNRKYLQLKPIDISTIYGIQISSSETHQPFTPIYIRCETVNISFVDSFAK